MAYTYETLLSILESLIGTKPLKDVTTNDLYWKFNTWSGTYPYITIRPHEVVCTIVSIRSDDDAQIVDVTISFPIHTIVAVDTHTEPYPHENVMGVVKYLKFTSYDHVILADIAIRDLDVK